MPAYYFERSALVKRYFRETGTEWLRALIAAGAGPLYVAEITAVEIIATIARRGTVADLIEGDVATTLVRAREHFQTGYEVVGVGGAVIERAVGLAETYALRGYDAVQLAATLTLRERRRAAGLSDPVLVSADDEVSAAAATEGLTVENPNGHP